MPKSLIHPLAWHRCGLVAGLALAALAQGAIARNAPDFAPPTGFGAAPAMVDSAVTGQGATAGHTYADLVDLAIASPIVVRAVVHRQSRLKPVDSPGLQPGFARLYIEADTAALLVGPELGESLRFLADVPVDANGRVAKLAKTPVLLFGRAVPGKPGELQLTAADTMLPWSAALEARLRAILTELVNPDAPPRIVALREAVHVPGNLTGEGETQFFFATDGGKPVSISVVRRPGEPTRWGVSFTELVDQAASPPQPESLAWYRLACSLPPAIPDRAAISATDADKQIAVEDYVMVRQALGPCTRNHAGG
ncbi:hypothetical protein [Novosphingobium sp.]|uniref:hypothetical protein n=1 Tax=Novosphingobium sp. TaxID=1874826 RepID=UPI003341A8F4